MDNNIFQTVFDSLEADTTELDKLRTEYAALEAKIKEGRYSDQTLAKEIYPKRDALRRQISDSSARAIEKAKGIVNQYRQDAERLNELDPAALTDDIKLLQPGIKLKPQDVQGMLKRNEGNRTMTQIILRYAEENGIETRTQYVGGRAEKQNAASLDGIISYYARWIDKDNAHEMLRKFFNV